MIINPLINEYVPFEYPEVNEYFPDQSYDIGVVFKEFQPPLTREADGKFYAHVGSNLYVGPFNTRNEAHKEAQRIHNDND